MKPIIDILRALYDFPLISQNIIYIILVHETKLIQNPLAGSHHTDTSICAPTRDTKSRTFPILIHKTKILRQIELNNEAQPLTRLQVRGPRATYRGLAQHLSSRYILSAHICTRIQLTELTNESSRG